MMRQAVEKEKQDFQSRQMAVPREDFQVLLEVCHLYTTVLWC
jgi:hypothetical protein